MKVVLAGGTGFIGSALLKALRQGGHQALLLSRDPRSAQDLCDSLGVSSCARAEGWDGRSLGAWASELDGADAVVNLAGESVARRWTSAAKTRIMESRLRATRAIVAAIAGARKPPVLVNASAVGYYGDVSEGEVDESHPKGSGFLAEVCERWEGEALRAKTRVVLLRIGVVLDQGGGALDKMLPPFRLFLGGPLGSGRQWLPWVHRRDVADAALFAIGRPDLSGPVNMTAPQPATMREFCAELGRALGRPSWAPVPAFALRLALGEMSEMLLGGQRASPKRLLACGYRFRYPDLTQALAAILPRP